MNLLKTEAHLVYDLTHIARLFVTQVSWVDTLTGKGWELSIELDGQEAVVILWHEGTEVERLCADNGKWTIKSHVYAALERHFETKSQYGILVGVRPVKVVHQMLEDGLTEAAILERLRTFYHIHPQKADLLLRVARVERPYLKSDLDRLSLYLGIPFCPSLCTYCSFPSNDIRKKGKKVAPYVDRLIEEIDETFELIRDHGKVVDVIYIGGGTPTVLSPGQMDQILRRLSQHLDLTALKEFTVEAGRPETIDDAMLEVLERHHVSRICLNPQSLDDGVLQRIGRLHSAGDILEAYEVIRRHRFDSVNMDLIVGLPGESSASFRNTLREVIRMRPENITVHTLALKKASEIRQHPEDYDLPTAHEVEQWLEWIAEALSGAGYEPYYLYRQKNIIGNFENVGYALKGKTSVYNIRIIEERHPILALGVGGVSKKVHADHRTFDRIPNSRSLEDYLERFEEMLRRKQAFFDLTDPE